MNCSTDDVRITKSYDLWLFWGFLVQTCESFLKHFSWLSEPKLPWEFNEWHRTMIRHDALVQLLGDRLDHAFRTNKWRDQILILKILGILMLNPGNHASFQRNGGAYARVFQLHMCRLITQSSSVF